MSATSFALSPTLGVAPASRPRATRGPQRHTHLSEPASRWVDWLRAGGRLTDRTGRLVSVASLFGAAVESIQIGSNPEVSIGRATGARI